MGFLKTEMKGMTQQDVLVDSSEGWSAHQELGVAQKVVCCLTKGCCQCDSSEFNPV